MDDEVVEVAEETVEAMPIEEAAGSGTAGVVVSTLIISGLTIVAWEGIKRGAKFGWKKISELRDRKRKQDYEIVDEINDEEE